MNVSFKVKLFDASGTQILSVAKASLTIGSADHCDVVVKHASVAAEHARAWLDGGRIWVQDLGSAGGTALNDIRLPALKPMLVRDLDVMRLGASESTLGLEALVVRAPVVKMQPTPITSGEVSLKTILPLDPKVEKPLERDLEVERRRGELASLARELADLRLQMQITKLEKSSDQELSVQLANLREEVKHVHEQKAKWTETLRQLEVEKQNLRKKNELELNDLRQVLLAEAANQREKEHLLLADWKTQSLSELTTQIHGLSVEKIRLWATRPLSQEMVQEWEADLGLLLRRTLLGENVRLPQRAKPENVPPLKVDPIATAQTSTGIAIAMPPPVVTASKNSGPEKPRERRRKKRNPLFRTLGFASVWVLIAGLGFYLASAYLKNHGVRAVSSQSVAPLRPEHRAARFEPPMNKKYRASYTDNVLYLENYVAAETNSDFRQRWLDEVYKAGATDWKVDHGAMVNLTSREQILLQDLYRMKSALTVDNQAEGIQAMRTREAKFLQEGESFLKSHSAVDRFLKFKKNFYVRNQAFLSTSTAP